VFLISLTNVCFIPKLKQIIYPNERPTMLNGLRHPVRRGVCLAALLLAFGSISCIVMRTINFRELPVEPKVTVEPGRRIPLRVAISVSDAFKTFAFPIDQHGISGAHYKGTILLGRNLTMDFYRVAGEVFDHAFFTEGFLPGQPLVDTDAQLILVPELYRFDFQAPISGFAFYSVEMKASISAYDAKGALLEKRYVESKGSTSSLGASMASGHYAAVKRMLDGTTADLLTRMASEMRAITPSQRGH
jgi:hypothetical protein